eukprot:1149025-Amphidinium_carterae.1
MTAEWVLGDPHGYISESDFRLELVYVDATRAASLAAVAVGVQRSLHDIAGAGMEPCCPTSTSHLESAIDNNLTTYDVNYMYRVLTCQPAVCASDIDSHITSHSVNNVYRVLAYQPK